MKRALSVIALTALMVLVGAVVLTSRLSNRAPGDPGIAMADTTGAPAAEANEKKESPAEEKKESPAAEKAEEKGEAKHHMGHKAKAMSTPMVDINSASKEDLMKVSGVTDEIAEKIMAGRPFASRSELLSKKILTAAEYAKIKGKVVAKKAKAAAK